MRRLKGGVLLLILGIPLVGYCALQVKDVLRGGFVTSEQSTDRGATKEQLAAAHAKATAWQTEVRKAATMTYQYRAAGVDDKTADAAASAVVKTSANRSADLNDLDLFLSEVERPVFAGRLKDQYERWTAERKELKRDEQAITDWLSKPPTISSNADATKAMDAFIALLTQYSTRSKFSDASKAAVWRVKGRLTLIDALATVADSQYRTVLQVKLPLESSNMTVKTAVDTLRAMKAMMTALGAEVAAAEEEKKLEVALRTAVDVTNAIADECAAREELLALFTKEDLFTNAAGVSAWLAKVAEQHRKTKDEKARKLIRDKVQEFCNAFIPTAVRLDDKVLLKGKEVERKNIVIKYQMTLGGAVMRKPLSGELDGVNEFNLAMKHPGENTFVVHMGSEEYPKDLKPTDVSKAAVLYNGERKQLADRTIIPKWSAKTLAELKKKCEAQKELVDQLKTLDDSVGKEPKIWTRLTGLETGIADNAELFEGGR